ncbi:MAG TPA: cell division protein FtsQ/DivIB [Solirubrobacterales bacterium]
MSRWRLIAGGAAALIAIFAVYSFFLADESVAPPSIRIAFATAVIGEGEEALGVTPYGEVLSGKPAPKEGTLPSLPDVPPPKNGRLSGPMLAQAKVLGAAPEPLRPCIARSYHGESGVDVELRSGIEVRFGDPTRVAEKWVAAIALLADPAITALDYVNVSSPARLSTGGSGHSLPAAGEGEGEGCGT